MPLKSISVNCLFHFSSWLNRRHRPPFRMIWWVSEKRSMPRHSRARRASMNACIKSSSNELQAMPKRRWFNFCNISISFRWPNKKIKCQRRIWGSFSDLLSSNLSNGKWQRVSWSASADRSLQPSDAVDWRAVLSSISVSFQWADFDEEHWITTLLVSSANYQGLEL